MGVERWVREWGRAPHNEWEHIYLSHWAWPRGGTATDYMRGSGFFRIHWEVVLPDGTGQVSFHVESPTADVDAVLNELKVSMIDAVVASGARSTAESHGLGFRTINRRRETLAGQKLTSAFAVTLPDAWGTESPFVNMVRVHDLLGDNVERAIVAMTPLLDRRFAELAAGA